MSYSGKCYVGPWIDKEGNLGYGILVDERGKPRPLSLNWKDMVYPTLEEANETFTRFMEEKKREIAAKPYTESEAIQFVESQYWIWASSYANTAPHEYLAKYKMKYIEDRLDFERFISTMKWFSKPGYFYSRKNEYYILGDYYYWTGWFDNFPCDLINRGHISQLTYRDGYYHYERKKI